MRPVTPDDQTSKWRPPALPTLVVYNLLYWPYLLATAVLLFVPAALIFAVTFPDPRRRWLHAYTCLWASHYLAWAPLAGVGVRGREHIPADRPCIYVSNHQSMVDILAVFALRRPFLWVSKIENFLVPFLGWNMFFNRYIPLRRGYLPSIMRMVRTCNARIAEGHCLFVFPEGTRSVDGEIATFHRGAFFLAARNRVPVVPVLLHGTREILAKHSFGIRPRPVVMSILPPIDPSSTSYDDRALSDRVSEAMIAELARLRATTSGAAAP